MKILVIPTWYPNGEDKLMGIYHKEFTNALNKYGIEADMLFVDRQRLSKPLSYLFTKKFYIDHEENYEVYVQRMLNLQPLGFDIQIKSYCKILERVFKKYLQDNPKPDVLHAQVTVPAGYAAVELGKKYDIPVVVTEHGGLLERFFKDEPFKKYGLYVLEHSTYTTVSRYMKDIVLKYTDVCEVLPNQVDTSLFANDTKRRIKGTFNLITVCALREGKRLDIAFKAIKKLVDKGLDIHYDIVGDGFYEENFKNACHATGLDDHVTFHGRMDKPAIAELMKREHALLISSEIESFAIPGIEALASGLPVIATDCKGPRDFVDETTGIIAKVNDPDDLASAIETLIANYDKYDKKHLEEVASRFSEKSVVEKAKKIYEKASKKSLK